MNVTEKRIQEEAQDNLAAQQKLIQMAFGWRELDEGVRRERIPYEVKALNSRLVWLLREFHKSS